MNVVSFFYNFALPKIVIDINREFIVIAVIRQKFMMFFFLAHQEISHFSLSFSTYQLMVNFEHLNLLIFLTYRF